MARTERGVRIVLAGRELKLDTLRAVLRAPAGVSLGRAAIARVRRAATTIERVVAKGQTVYGVNTGFGSLAQTLIPSGQLELLQRNLVMSGEFRALIGAPMFTI